MWNNQEWSPTAKVVVYCPIGRALDMAKFSITGAHGAIKNTGLLNDEFELVFITWKTAPEVYAWLKENNFKYEDQEYDEGKGFLWNLYKCGWNAGYEVGFKHADYVVAIGTDHAFAPNWLANLIKHSQPNRLVNCKLIEPGLCQTIHTTYNFGMPKDGEFKSAEFTDYANKMLAQNSGQLATNELEYGRRFDASPFAMPRDVWERFGPMSQTICPTSPDPMGIYVFNITGDTDFFNRAKTSGVEASKALDAISYHWGAGEASANQNAGVYT